MIDSKQVAERIVRDLTAIVYRRFGMVNASDLFDHVMTNAERMIGTALDAARQEERERCARIAEDWHGIAVRGDLSGGYTANQIDRRLHREDRGGASLHARNAGAGRDEAGDGAMSEHVYFKCDRCGTKLTEPQRRLTIYRTRVVLWWKKQAGYWLDLCPLCGDKLEVWMTSGIKP